MGLKVRRKYYIRTWNMGLKVRRKYFIRTWAYSTFPSVRPMKVLYKNMGLKVFSPHF